MDDLSMSILILIILLYIKVSVNNICNGAVNQINVC